jgi:hypothetical protein
MSQAGASVISTPIDFSADDPSYGDGDESGFELAMAGGVSLTLVIDSLGNITGTASAEIIASGIAIDDTDGDDDSFNDEGMGSGAVSGSVGSSISSSFTLDDGTSVSISGNVNAAQNTITGTITISDPNVGASVTLPLSGTFTFYPEIASPAVLGQDFNATPTSNQDPVATSDQSDVSAIINGAAAVVTSALTLTQAQSALSAARQLLNQDFTLVYDSEKVIGFQLPSIVTAADEAAGYASAGNAAFVGTALATGLNAAYQAYQDYQQNGTFTSATQKAAVEALGALGTGLVGNIIGNGVTIAAQAILLGEAPLIAGVVAGGLAGFYLQNRAQTLINTAYAVGTQGFLNALTSTNFWFSLNTSALQQSNAPDGTSISQAISALQQSSALGGASTTAGATIAPNGAISNLALTFASVAPSPKWTYDADNGTFTWNDATTQGALTTSLSQLGVVPLAAPLKLTGSNTIITGGPLGDQLTVGPGGNDLILGGSGDNVITSGPGNNVLVGGSGPFETLSYSGAPGRVTVNLTTDSSQNGYGGTDQFSNFQGFVGGSGNDTFIGGPGSHFINGSSGVNTLDYSAATSGVLVNFTLGMAYNNFGGTVVNTDEFAGIQVFLGGSGNNTFTGAPSGYIINGGVGGTNTLDCSIATTPMVFDLPAGTAAGGVATDTFANIQSFIGGSGNDTFVSGPGGNHAFVGNGGVNTLNTSNAATGVFFDLTRGLEYNNYNGASVRVDSFSGIQVFVGGAGNNTFVSPGPNGDVLVGGPAVNTLDYSASTAGVAINLATASVTSGNRTPDTFVDMTIFKGGQGADLFVGGPGGNHVFIGGPSSGNTLDYATPTQGSGIEFDLVHDVAYNNFNGTAVTTDSFANIENFIGGSGNNTFLAGPGGNHVFNGGGGGVNTLSYAAATSEVYFDLVYGIAYDNLSGTAVTTDIFGNFQAFMGGSGNDVFHAATPTGLIMNGAGGTNTLDYSPATANITFNLATGVASANTGRDIFGGMQVFEGGSGNDTFVGGPGGSHAFVGNGGVNTINYSDASTPVEFDLIHDVAYNNFNGSAVTTDSFSGIEIFVGGAGGNTFIGGSEANNYVFIGGPNANTFEFSGAFGFATIENFVHGSDVIQLSQSQGAHLHFNQSGANAVISFNGDTTDAITLLNYSAGSLQASDFHFG